MSATKNETDEAIERVKNGDYVIRATESNGAEVDFACTPLDIWVRIRPKGEGHVTEETSVRNTMKLCYPDWEVIPESESHFGIEE